MIRATVSGIKETIWAFRKFEKDTEKARSIAIKIEAYRLRKVLLNEIKKGAPGGNQYKELSIASRATVKGLGRRKPFTKLFSTQGAPAPGKGVVPVRYKETVKGKQFEIGFTSDLSKSWRYLMGYHQTGGSRPISDKTRASWRRRGAYWKKKFGSRSRSKLTKVFFLKKSTKIMKDPKRPMVDPFWAAHERTAIKNIESNFDRKMRGEKI